MKKRHTPGSSRPDRPAATGPGWRHGLALVLGMVSAMAEAAPITGNDAMVLMCLMPSSLHGRATFNPRKAYGDVIRYIRLGRPLRVVVNGVDYDLDVDAAIEEAMAEWHAAVPRLRFQSTTSAQADGKAWRVEISNLDIRRLGGGYRIGTHALDATGSSFNPQPELVFYPRGFERAAGMLQMISKRLQSDRVPDFLAFLMRMVAKHEIGHLLGFLHTPATGVNASDAAVCIGQALYTPTNGTALPPIMAENFDVATRLMYQYFERPLRIDDIQIAPQEAAVMRQIMEETCPVDLHPFDGATARKSPTDCLKASRVISPLTPEIMRILLLD